MSYGVFEFLATVIGIAMVVGVKGFFVEEFDNLGVCWGIGFADAHVDEGEMRIVFNGGEFGAFNFFKFIEIIVLSEGRTSDSFSE